MNEKSIKEISISKELFIESINEIEKQYNHDQKCSEAFKVILPDDFITSYDNSFLLNQLLKILKISMNDNHKHSWIEYFIYELDFGRNWKKDCVLVHGENFNLKNPNDLWDLLNI
jgi:hypothetical protein